MPIVGKTGGGGGLGRERAGVERRRAGIVICGGTPAFRGVRRGNCSGDRVDPNRRKKTHGHSRFFEWGALEERRTIRRVSCLLVLQPALIRPTNAKLWRLAQRGKLRTRFCAEWNRRARTPATCCMR